MILRFIIFYYLIRFVTFGFYYYGHKPVVYSHVLRHAIYSLKNIIRVLVKRTHVIRNIIVRDAFKQRKSSLVNDK